MGLSPTLTLQILSNLCPNPALKHAFSELNHNKRIQFSSKHKYCNTFSPAEDVLLFAELTQLLLGLRISFQMGLIEKQQFKGKKLKEIKKTRKLLRECKIFLNYSVCNAPCGAQKALHKLFDTSIMQNV